MQLETWTGCVEDFIRPYALGLWKWKERFAGALKWTEIFLRGRKIFSLIRLIETLFLILRSALGFWRTSHDYYSYGQSILMMQIKELLNRESKHEYLNDEILLGPRPLEAAQQAMMWYCQKWPSRFVLETVKTRWLGALVNLLLEVKVS
jgi:hypothetical protein